MSRSLWCIPRAARINGALTGDSAVTVRRLRHACIGMAMTVAASAASQAGALGAQTADHSRARRLRELDSLITQTAALATQVPSTAQMVSDALRGSPGSSAGSTGAWGAGWGDVFFGVGFQERARYTNKPDGSGS